MVDSAQQLRELRLADNRDAVLSRFLRLAAHGIGVGGDQQGTLLCHIAHVQAGGGGALRPLIARDVHRACQCDAVARLEGELGGGGAGLWFAEKRLHARGIHSERFCHRGEFFTLVVGDHAVGPGLDGELARELLVDRLNVVGVKPGGDGGVLQLAYLGAGNVAVYKHTRQLAAVGVLVLRTTCGQSAGELPGPGGLGAARQAAALLSLGGEAGRGVARHIRTAVEVQVAKQVGGRLRVGEG